MVQIGIHSYKSLLIYSVPFHLFGNGGGALAIGKNYARNAQIGKKSRRKILSVIPCLI